MEFTAQQIAQLIEGTVEGDADAIVRDVSKIEEGREHTLSFFSNPKYEHYVYSTSASVIIVNNDFKPTEPVKATLIRVPNSYQALAKLLEMYNQMQPQKVGIEQPSFISKSATVGEFAYVGAFAYIGENVKIGKNVKIYPQVYVGDNVEIGDDTTLYAGVRIYKGCKIGSRCILHAGCVVGADGFGFAPDENRNYKKIPQVGNVVIADDVEVGANTCIDRATMGSTRVNRGVKLDNLVQIAHNVEIGESTVMAAQGGVAGSTKVGKHCMFGGQVGIAGHITIADGLQCGAQTGINSSIKDTSRPMIGSPVMDAQDFMRSFVVFRKLPQLKRDIDTLMAKNK
ncbi:MAG: UDP-3-O-(3-hydroxymyristoyl)glucosamine N-acyltransferase [Marinilabiliaceae bacterium]|nr:UDP-3-O-(3-hydroxymyristoyl)glucosamine N-acyltransferase [Marinilabiliaceae bacterium]